MSADNKIFRSRRQFIKAGSILTLQMLSGNISAMAFMNGEAPHHTINGYRNYPIRPEPSFPGITFLMRRIKNKFDPPNAPDSHFLKETDAISGFYQNANSISLTWIGHSTFLLKIAPKIILLDPFFSDVAGPLWLGPKRYVKPGILLKNLPKIDILLLSHNHYDHLDEDAIRRLPGKESLKGYVPLGLKSYFVARGYTRVKELDWYDSV